MIELIPSEHDGACLQLARRIVNGAVAAVWAWEVYLVQVDCWFDHKWLGFWSRGRNKDQWELCGPPFNPNRILSEKRFACDAGRARWTLAALGKPLHRRS